MHCQNLKWAISTKTDIQTNWWTDESTNQFNWMFSQSAWTWHKIECQTKNYIVLTLGSFSMSLECMPCQIFFYLQTPISVYSPKGCLLTCSFPAISVSSSWSSLLSSKICSSLSSSSVSAKHKQNNDLDTSMYKYNL